MQGPCLSSSAPRALVERQWVPEVVMRHQPSLVVTFDEPGAKLGLCVGEAARRGVATPQAVGEIGFVEKVSFICRMLLQLRDKLYSKIGKLTFERVLM